MWIGYVRDRQKLGFSCIKDINSVEQLLDFTSTLKNSLTYTAQKSNKTFIFIFSKEIIVAIFIFLEYIYTLQKIIFLNEDCTIERVN
jgi:hypothetical protein